MATNKLSANVVIEVTNADPLDVTPVTAAAVVRTPHKGLEVKVTSSLGLHLTLVLG